MHRRTLVVVSLVLIASWSSAGASDEGDLPDVLVRHGFGDPKVPITVVFTSPAGEAEDHPKLADGKVAPVNTLWVFDDPAPIRKVLARARTRRFSAGRIPGADARMILYAGPEKADARIYLNYRPGWGVVKANRKKGGEWHFDPAADRALVDLLSRTTPRAVGVPVRGVIEAVWKPGLPIKGPDYGTMGVPADWARLKERVVTRHASARLELPAWFSWDEHFVVVAWLPPRGSRDRLDWGNARFADDTITWDLREDREKEEAKSHAPVTIGFFASPPSRSMQLAMRLDGRVVKKKPISPRMGMPGDPDLAALLVPRDPKGVRIGMLVLFKDRSWHWEPDGDDKEGSGVRSGKVPPKIGKEIWGGFGKWKVQPGSFRDRMHDVRVDDEAAFPPGTRALLEHIGLLR